MISGNRHNVYAIRIKIKELQRVALLDQRKNDLNRMNEK